MFLPYRPIIAFLGKIVNVCTTFLWTYMDLFVMLIGVGLSSRFRQINESLMRHKGQVNDANWIFTCVNSIYMFHWQEMPESFWNEHRQYYRNMCDLCQAVDDAMSKITMVSFANNLYFVCVQLLRSLNRMPSVIHAVYFWFSLIFLITRTLAVSLYSAEINDESKKPIMIFRSVPRASWCLEVIFVTKMFIINNWFPLFRSSVLPTRWRMMWSHSPEWSFSTSPGSWFSV